MVTRETFISKICSKAYDGSMDSFGIQFDASGLIKGLDELGKAVINAIMKGLFLSGEQLRSDSVMIVPFDKGFNGGLAGSASTQLPVDDGMGNLEVTVGYNMPYAAKLHEDMTLHIKQTNTVAGQKRQQKYLEKPAKENAQKYGTIIRDSFNEALQ